MAAEVSAEASEIPRFWKWLGVYALVVLALAAGLPSLTSNFVWNDGPLVHGERLHTTIGLKSFWSNPAPADGFAPLGHSLLWAEQKAFGDSDALPFRLVSLALHAACGTALWRLLRQLRLPGGWVVSALFVVHPLQVQAFSLIGHQPVLLAALLTFVSLALYVRWADLEAPADLDGQIWEDRVFAIPDGPRIRFAAVWMTSLAAALAFPPIGFVAPLAGALLAAWRGEPERQRRYGLNGLLVAGSVVVLAMWCRLDWQATGGRTFNASSLFAGALVACRAAWFYLLQTLLPIHLSVDYPHWDLSARSWHLYVWPVLTIAAALLAFRQRHRLSTASRIVALLWTVSVFAQLGFINGRPPGLAFVADPVAYLAVAPAMVGVVGSLRLVARWLAARRRVANLSGPPQPSVDSQTAASRWNRRWSRRLATAAGLVALAGLSALHATDFRSDRDLWLATLARQPGSVQARLSLASLDLRQGDRASAQGHLNALLARGSIDASTLLSIGQMVESAGDLRQAIGIYQRATALSPSDADAWFKVAQVLSRLHRTADAITAFETGIRLNANDPVALNNFATALMTDSQTRRAERVLVRAISLSPSSSIPRLNLANLMAGEGRLEEAAAEYSASMEESPEDPDVCYATGMFLLARGQADAALPALQRSLKRRPESLPASFAIARVYELVGRQKEAVFAYRKCLQLDGHHAPSISALARLQP